MKQAIVIYKNGKPVEVYEIKNFVDSTEFLKKKKECEENALELEREQKAKDNKIIELDKRINALEHEIKVLKGEE